MLSKKNKQELRSILFRHLDGIATAPTAFALHEKGGLQFFLDKKKISLQELTTSFKANEGYLNVALRILCSQGWLVQHIDNEQDVIEYSLSDLSDIAFSQVHFYADVVHLVYFPLKVCSEGSLILSWPRLRLIC